MGIGRTSDFFAINGKQMISPAAGGVKVQFDSMADENSGRTADGVMHINWIWRTIRKVNIKLPPLTREEVAAVLSQVQGQEYDLTYPDPIKGTHTIHCYTSNSSTDCQSGVLYNGLWINASFNAIELEGER